MSSTRYLPEYHPLLSHKVHHFHSRRRPFEPQVERENEDEYEDEDEYDDEDEDEYEDEGPEEGDDD